MFKFSKVKLKEIGGFTKKIMITLKQEISNVTHADTLLLPDSFAHFLTAKWRYHFLWFLREKTLIQTCLFPISLCFMRL